MFAGEGLDKARSAAGGLISMPQLAVEPLTPGEELAISGSCCRVKRSARHLDTVASMVEDTMYEKLPAIIFGRKSTRKESNLISLSRGCSISTSHTIKVSS